jgi:biotin carboxyl carrier protein
MADQPIDPRVIEQTRQQIRQLVAEINHLAASEAPPQKFYPEFLNKVIQAVAARGGALWIREGQTPPRLQSEQNFRSSGLLDDMGGTDGHTTLLLRAFEDGQAKLCLPHSPPEGSNNQAGTNTSDSSLIVSPLKVDKHSVGVVELLLDPARRDAAQRNAVKFVAELCEMGATYLKNRQLRHMLNQQHLWTQLETFVRQIHASIRTRECSYIVANEGKRLVDCDRLSVALVRGKRPVIYAVSGQEVVERKANLIQLMARLAQAVIRNGENLVYTGEIDENLTPAVRDALDDYLAEGSSKALAVTILRPSDKEGKPQEPIGALIGEHLEDATAAQTLAPRMDVIAQHGTVALSNAIEYERIPLLPVWRTLGHAREWMRGRRLVKLLLVLMGIGAIASFLLFYPWELRLEGKGELATAPEHRRVVYAPEDGTVVEVPIDDGQLVPANTPLIGMTNPEIDRELADLRRERDKAQTQLTDATRLLATPAHRSDPNASATAAVTRQQVQSLTEQIKLIEDRKRSLHVTAPIPGMVATWDVKLQLGGRPVKRGDPLVTLAGVDKDKSKWVLEIRMPEDNMGHILAARDRQAGKPLQVWFMAANRPQDQFRGTVQRIATQAEYDRERQEHVQRITVKLEGVQQYEPQIVKEGAIEKVTHISITFEDGRVLKLSPGAEVHAKVECGQCSVGYVLLREVIELVHEVLF